MPPSYQVMPDSSNNQNIQNEANICLSIIHSIPYDKETMGTKFHLSRASIISTLPLLLPFVIVGIIAYFSQVYWKPSQVAVFLGSFGPISMVVYVIIVTLANIAAPVSASPLLILGFSLYQQSAIWLFAMGNVISMIVNFWIARVFGRKLIIKVLGEAALTKIDDLSRNYGLLALFGVRLFLSGVSDLASYAFGLSPIKFKPYLIVSIIGFLPPYLLLYAFSSHDQGSLEFMLLQLLIAGLLSAVFLGGRFLVRKFMQLLLYGKL
jgi:uncharacterized membrane protein YdjX (TVP38/TMEM64 family)